MPDEQVGVHDLADIGTALRLLVPGYVRAGVRGISQLDLTTLKPGELEHVRGAAEVRRHEFATGRVLLRDLVGRDVEIPVRADRSPELPADVVGSLAHDRHVAVAVVADARSVRALGVDIEPFSILATDEQALVLSATDSPVDPVLGWCMKEAAFKAWSALGGAAVDPREMHLAVSGDGFAVQINDARLEGSYRAVSGRWLAAVVDA